MFSLDILEEESQANHTSEKQKHRSKQLRSGYLDLKNTCGKFEQFDKSIKQNLENTNIMNKEMKSQKQILVHQNLDLQNQTQKLSEFLKNKKVPSLVNLQKGGRLGLDFLDVKKEI